MAERAKKGKARKSKACKSSDEEKPNSEEIKSKKPSMKTATDVISRLQWDDSLPQDKFTVGYLDRFDGIVEKPFTSLDWSEPAAVDYHTLALPKHRIQYFKYMNRKVWDKRSRTDIIFGSTGFPVDIHMFMRDVDSEILNFRDEELMMPTRAGKSLNPDRVDDDDCYSEEDYDNTNRGNFFIAARIKNESTVKNLKNVSDYIISRDELLGQCCIPAEKLHLTLCILKLDSHSDIIDATLAMKAVAAQNLSPVTLELEGLDNFHHRVLFSRIVKNDNLYNLRNVLVEKLVSRTITDKFSFVPHVTLAKISRPVARLRHSNFIDQYLYLKFEDDYFGSQEITDLCLCEMGAVCRDDGFYKCASEIALNHNNDT